MKKRISLLLACCLLLCMAPVALADADIQIEDGAAVELPQDLEVVEDGAPELDPDALELDALDPDALELDEMDAPSAPAEEAPAEEEAVQNAIGDIVIGAVNFPDDNFRKYIAENCDTNHDGMLSAKERKAVKSLKLNGRNIKSLKGIDVFTVLEELSCFDNKLTSLSVYRLKALKSLDCYNNKLTSLDVHGLRALKKLYCYGNRLSGRMDLRGCPALEELGCRHNKLTGLDVRGLVALDYVDCYDNKLSILDVRGCKKLTTLLCEDNRFKALNLTGDAALIRALMNGNDSGSEYDYKNVIYVVYGKVKIRFDDAITVTADGEKLYVPEADRVPLMDCRVEKINEQSYTGNPVTPSPVVRYGNKTLRQGIDFTVSYSNNRKIGIAEAIIEGKSLYKGKISEFFSINPRPVKLLSLSAGKGYLTAKWEESGGGASYQLQCTRYSSFGGSGKIEVKWTKDFQIIEGLESGVTYRVRIRAFKKVGRVTHYSPWSASLSAEVE